MHIYNTRGGRTAELKSCWWKKKCFKKIAQPATQHLTHPKIELMFTIWPRSFRSLSLSRISFTASRVTGRRGRGEGGGGREIKFGHQFVIVTLIVIFFSSSLLILISSSSHAKRRDWDQRTYAECEYVCIHDFCHLSCIVVVENEALWVNIRIVDLEEKICWGDNSRQLADGFIQVSSDPLTNKSIPSNFSPRYRKTALIWCSSVMSHSNGRSLPFTPNIVVFKSYFSKWESH